MRRALTLLLAALVLAAPAAVGASAAQAADQGYRYWSFWEQKDGGGDWTYATKGPGVLRPGDGDVLGFRFAVSEDSKDAAQPRGEVSFGAACARTEKKPGAKRVALRLDFGTRADAPRDGIPPKARTACARIDEDGTAADALAAVSEPLRYNSDSLLCAIDGYPRKGCGGSVSKTETTEETEKADGTATAEAYDESGGGGDGDDGSGGLSSGLGIGAGVAAVAVLGAAALWQARRRR